MLGGRYCFLMHGRLQAFAASGMALCSSWPHSHGLTRLLLGQFRYRAEQLQNTKRLCTVTLFDTPLARLTRRCCCCPVPTAFAMWVCRVRRCRRRRRTSNETLKLVRWSRTGLTWRPRWQSECCRATRGCGSGCERQHLNHRKCLNLSPKLFTQVWRVCCASLPVIPSDTLPPAPLRCCCMQSQSNRGELPEPYAGDGEGSAQR